jgi:hypothetical protein
MQERQRIVQNELLRRVNADARRRGCKAALEAVFSRAPEAELCAPAPRSSGRRVAPSAPPVEDSAKKALLARLLEVEGRDEITRAADAYFAAGFDVPQDQAALVKLLEHHDEARVREALAALDSTLASRPPARRTILEARVRRLEDQAEEPATRDLAARVRRRLGGSTLTSGSR